MRSTLLRWLLCCMPLLVPALAWADANDDIPVVGSTDELFKLLHAEDRAQTAGDSIDDILKEHVAGGQVDEGTYPPSDLWERQFNQWREPGDELTYNGRLRLKYSKDTVSHITKWEKETELNFKYGNWAAYTRFSDLNEFSYVNDPMRWQKFWLSYRGDDYKATIGSVGGVFGRGLALNMFEDRLLEFDNEVEGAKVEYSFGHSDATVITGTNKLRSEPRASSVLGTQLRTKLNEHADAGMYFVDVAFPEPAAGAPITTTSIDPPPSHLPADATATPVNMNHFRMTGADVTLRFGKLGAYAELMHLRRPVQPWGNNSWQNDGSDGRALYATASYSGNGYSLTGEYKDYFHVQQPFGVLPTARRWEEKAQATPDDDKGYNFQLLMTPKNGSSWALGYGQDGPHTQIERPYTEAMATYTSPSKHGFGYVAETFRILDEVTRWDINRVTLNHKLDNDWTSSAVLQRKRHDTPYTDAYTFLLFDTELAYQSKFDIVYTHEASNQPGANPDQWDLFEAKYHPDDNQELNVTYGARRSGYVCSGGVCRLEPEFNGTKVEYLLRF